MVGVTTQRGLLALSVGDHVGNLLSPFCRSSRRCRPHGFPPIIGYSVVFGVLWFVLGVAIFTFVS